MFSIEKEEVIKDTYLQKLPFDIIEYIISINKQWAIKILKNPMLNYNNNLLKKDVKAMYDLVGFAMQSNLGCTLDNYCIHLKDKIYNRERVFDKLIKCKCCDRHQRLRPKEFKPWIETEFNWNDAHRTCQCSCRHMARMICRSIS